MQKQLFIFFLILGSLSAMAQTGVSDEQVDVIRDYNPILADALKISLTAQVPSSSAVPETLQYKMDVNYFELPYQPVKIKPIALNKTPEEELENVYVKAGFGTQLTPLAQVYLNSNRSDKVNYGLYGDYISSNGKDFKDYSHLVTGGKANFYLDKDFVIPINAKFTNDVVYYYGYNPDSISFEKDDIKQRFTGYGFDVGFENLSDNKLKLNYKIKAGLSGLNDINKYGVLNPFLQLYADRELVNSHVAGAEILIDHFAHTTPVDQDFTITGLKLYYSIINEAYSLKMALDNVVESGGRYYALPFVEFSKDLAGDKFVFVAGWDTRLMKNNFQSIAKENPFISDSILFKTGVSDKKYAGFRGSTNGNFSFGVAGYYKLNRNMLFYVNNIFDTTRFDVLYSDAGLLGANMEVDYFNAGKFRIMAALNIFKFNELDLEKAWHTPTLNWSLAGTYFFNKKLSATADIFGVNKTYALMPDNRVETIDGTVDINLSAIYVYSRYFNIFLQVNNIASIQYQRYYNYPGYGINALAGISFSF